MLTEKIKKLLAGSEQFAVICYDSRDLVCPEVLRGNPAGTFMIDPARTQLIDGKLVGEFEYRHLPFGETAHTEIPLYVIYVLLDAAGYTVFPLNIPDKVLNHPEIREPLLGLILIVQAWERDKIEKKILASGGRVYRHPFELSFDSEVPGAEAAR